MNETNTQSGSQGTHESDKFREKFEAESKRMLDRFRELIAAGNARSVIIRRHGQVVAEFPLTVGVVGTILAPQVAALGAIAALLSESSIEVVHNEPQHPTTTV